MFKKSLSLGIVFAWLGLAATACIVGSTPNGVPTSTSTVEPTLLATNTPVGAQDSALPTLVPSLASGSLVSDATLPSDACQSTYHSRLAVASLARLLPCLPNSVRSQPVRASTRSNVIGTIPAGSTFQIVAGPTCDGGLIFWQVNYQSSTGWTAEADATTFYLEPVDAASSLPTSIDCPGSPTARLNIGQRARVRPGDPNILRSDAGLSTAVFGRLPAGRAFAVVGGPRCAGKFRLWQVNYNGQVGWTVEGQGGTYWLEPAPND